jgi:lipoate-protein ligase A
LRPTADRQYCHSPTQIGIELEELEADATLEQSKSAFYYMFNRVYNQWQEATLTEKQEHEAINNFKNSTKIPR